MVAGIALEGDDRVDHVLDHARAGDLAVLGDVADEDHGGAGRLGETDQGLGAAAHLRDGAGRRFDRLRPHGLDRVDDGEGRGLALREGGDDVLDIGLRRELDRRAGEAEALGAQADLRHRLLARDIGDPVAGGGERG